MSATTIKVKVKLFAAYLEAFGTPELTLEFPSSITAIALLNYLIAKKPELEKWRNLTRFGINYQFVEPHHYVKNGDEVVLIPPVSGG